MIPESLNVLAGAGYTAANILDTGLPKPGWPDAPQLVRDNYRTLVGSRLNENKTYQELHERWLTLMADAGWVFGDYDEVAKTHPWIKPWAELGAVPQQWMTVFADTVQVLKTTVEALEWSPR